MRRASLRPLLFCLLLTAHCPLLTGCKSNNRYDLIEADALWPTSPYAGNLYSLEFFRMRFPYGN